MEPSHRNFGVFAVILFLTLLLLPSFSGADKKPAWEIKGEIKRMITCPSSHSATIYVLAIPVAKKGALRVLETRPDILKQKEVSGYAVLGEPGPFQIQNLPAGQYILYAWEDVNGNRQVDHWNYEEPVGWYQTPDQLGLASTPSWPQGKAPSVELTLYRPAPYPDQGVSVLRGNGSGTLKTFKGYKILQLKGAPKERAYAQGYLTGPQIVDWLDACLLENFVQSVTRYEAKILPMVRNRFNGLCSYDDEFKAMLEGMKDGQTSLKSRILQREITIDDLKALNIYTEVVMMLRFGKFAAAETPISACSAVVVWGDIRKGKDTGVIHGKNMDGENDLRKVTVNSLLIVAVEPSRKGIRKVVSVDWPGFLGRANGMNEDGLTLLPHYSPSVPDFTVKTHIGYFFRYREILEQCASLEEAIAFWRKADQTAPLFGGFNTSASQPYQPGMADFPSVTIESDSYGFGVRFPGDVEPENPHVLLTANNYYVYRGRNPEAVVTVNGYHSNVLEKDYRYRNMMGVVEDYQFENKGINSPEVIQILRAASISRDYRGITEYSYIAFPNQRGFALAVEDLKNKILDATFAKFTQFTFDEVFE